MLVRQALTIKGKREVFKKKSFNCGRIKCPPDEWRLLKHFIMLRKIKGRKIDNM